MSVLWNLCQEKEDFITFVKQNGHGPMGHFVILCRRRGKGKRISFQILPAEVETSVPPEAFAVCVCMCVVFFWSMKWALYRTQFDSISTSFTSCSFFRESCGKITHANYVKIATGVLSLSLSLYLVPTPPNPPVFQTVIIPSRVSAPPDTPNLLGKIHTQQETRTLSLCSAKANRLKHTHTRRGRCYLPKSVLTPSATNSEGLAVLVNEAKQKRREKKR